MPDTFFWAQGFTKINKAQSLHSRNSQINAGDRQVDNIMLLNLIDTKIKICTGTSLVAQWLRIRLPGGFPGGAVVKNLPDNAGDMGLISGPGRSHMPRSN